MTLSRPKHKGRKEAGSFFAWPHVVARSEAYRTLSARGVKLLNDLCFQFRGANNGDLAVTWSMMKRRGWKSRDTLRKSLLELLDHGLIELTRQGGRHRCNLYALTWKPIDGCGGKLDVPAKVVPSHLWKQWPRAEQSFEKQNGDTIGVSQWHDRRANSRSSASKLARQAC